jgi:AMP nucleosidase
MTTADRNWEMSISSAMLHLQASRSIAVDMESATVAANGFRYRIPSATLLCISDKPLHGRPKLPDAAQAFYADTKAQHLEVARAAIALVKQDYQGGLPSTDLRAMDEPLFGSDA